MKQRRPDGFSSSLLLFVKQRGSGHDDAAARGPAHRRVGGRGEGGREGGGMKSFFRLWLSGCVCGVRVVCVMFISKQKK